MRNTYAYDTDVVMDDGSPPIRTTVTNSGDAVKRYLREVRKRGGRLLVGLDTEWRVIRSGAHRMAVLQLCVGRRCLVFQIARADYVPAALRAFLGARTTASPASASATTSSGCTSTAGLRSPARWTCGSRGGGARSRGQIAWG